MRWAVLLIILAGCALRAPPPVVPARHTPTVTPDPLISEESLAKAEALHLHGKGLEPDQMDSMTDRLVVMRAAVAKARAHPTAENRWRARDAIRELRAFIAKQKTEAEKTP